MIAELRSVTRALEARRLRTPLARLTESRLQKEAAHNDAITACQHWLAILAQWSEQIDRDARAREVSALRARHAAWCTEQRQLRERRDEAIWRYRAAPNDWLSDPCGIIREHLAAHDVREGHRAPALVLAYPPAVNFVPLDAVAVEGDRLTNPADRPRPLRVKVQEGHVGPRAWVQPYQRPFGPVLRPRYTMAAPRLDLPERAEHDHGFGVAQPLPEYGELDRGRPATDYPELRNKQFILELAGVDDHYTDLAYDAPCERCGKAPGLCACLDSAYEPPKPWAFRALEELDATLADVRSAIASLEGRRCNHSAGERDRLEEIRRLTLWEDQLTRRRFAQRQALLGIPRPGATQQDLDELRRVAEYGDVCPDYAKIRDAKFDAEYAGFAADADERDLARDELAASLRATKVA